MKPSTMILAAAAVCIAAPAWAHHSFSMFDRTRSVTVNGVVKEYEWTNPHVWIHLMVPDDAGTPREWSFEMQSIAQDSAAGWRSDSVKAGDRIRVEFHPLKDGSRGGAADERDPRRRQGSRPARRTQPRLPARTRGRERIVKPIPAVAHPLLEAFPICGTSENCRRLAPLLQCPPRKARRSNKV